MFLFMGDSPTSWMFVTIPANAATELCLTMKLLEYNIEPYMKYPHLEGTRQVYK
jgi:hypothetical protein